MDTAVLKSWCEVVRRTDPLIWALALEPQVESNIDSLILSPPPSSSLSPSSSALIASATIAAGSGLGSGSDATLEDMKATKRKMFSSLRNNYCKSLAGVSQPQNAIDWLKCLVQTPSTTTHDELYLKQNSHHLPRSRRSVGVGSEEAMISRRTAAASSEQQENMPTGSASGSSTGSTTESGLAPGSPSLTTLGSSTTASNTHQRMTTNASHNSDNNTYYATTFNWMYYATTQEPAAAATSPSTRFGSRNEDHAGASSPTSGNAVGGLGVGGAIISPSIATAATAAVASHIAGECEALGGGASASAVLSSGGGVELQGSAESTNNSDPLVNSSSSSSSNMDTAIPNHTMATATATATATTTVPSTTSKTTPQSLPARFKNLLPRAFAVNLASTTQFLYSSLLSTKDATTAFLYRTFSPTYRICALYKSSFTDGSQLRGLTRIKDSVMRADAVVLVKSSVGQMRDVWGMVMDAYGVKAKMAGEKKRREEREKVVREGREKVVREGMMRRSKEVDETKIATAATEEEEEEEEKESGGEEGGIGGRGGELE